VSRFDPDVILGALGSVWQRRVVETVYEAEWTLAQVENDKRRWVPVNELVVLSCCLLCRRISDDCVLDCLE
jgi:hypothetical protein